MGHLDVFVAFIGIDCRVFHIAVRACAETVAVLFNIDRLNSSTVWTDLCEKSYCVLGWVVIVHHTMAFLVVRPSQADSIRMRNQETGMK